MFGFGKPPKISPETRDWVHESFEWCRDNHLFHSRTQLVKLTDDFFDAPAGKDENTVKGLVANILRQVPHYEHLIDLIDVLPMARMSAEYRYDPTNSKGEVAGLFTTATDRMLIQYDAEQFEQPVVLINTLVHETMHACMHSFDHEFPGGPEAEELCTDFACVASGFGLFSLNAADQVGWTGYMRQTTRMYAFAKFLVEMDFADPVAGISNGRIRRWVEHYRKHLLTH